MIVIEKTLSCPCGQPLDCHHAGHCPRCGVALRASAGEDR